MASPSIPTLHVALTLEFTNRFPHHYFYNAVPEEFAGGPIPDVTKKAFCEGDICYEDVQVSIK